MATLKARLDALEQGTKHRLKPSVRTHVLIQLGERTPGQQDEIDAAKRAGRPILVIHSTPFEVDPALSVIVKVDEYGGYGSPMPDMTRLCRPESWE